MPFPPRSPRSARRLAPVAMIGLVALAAPALARAQGGQPPAPPSDRGAGDACFGFKFGRWTPPLDWKGAGHSADSSRGAPAAGVAQDGGRREWAADQLGKGIDV